MSSPVVSLRPAHPYDRERLFVWANDRLTREQSFASDPIAWDTHVQWFRSVMADAQRRLFIILDTNGDPIGQVRFDLGQKRDAEISISIAPVRRGEGLAAPAIRAATQHIHDGDGVRCVHAFVKPDNVASLRGFVRAGFAEQEMVPHAGMTARHLLWTTPSD